MGSLVVLDGPSSSFEFSIDSHAWQTGSLFRGLTGIPPGFHFVTFTIASTRSSHLLFLDQGQTVILEWNKEEEWFEVGTCLPMECPKLAPYPSGADETSWKVLTSHITKDVLDRVIQDIDGLYSFDQTWTSYHDKDISQDKSFGYLQIDLLKPAYATSASDLTRFAFDKSPLLEQLIPSNLLGEFQLSFLILAIGGNFSGLQQWNTILRLVCASTDAISKWSQWFGEFVVVLREQVSSPIGTELFSELFQSPESPMIIRALHELVMAMTEKGGRLKYEAESLCAVVKAKYFWDLPEDLPDDDEDQPIIV